MVDSEVECLPASEESPWNCHFSLLSQLFCFVLDYEEEHKYVEWYRNRSIQDTGRLCKAKHRKAFLTGYQGVQNRLSRDSLAVQLRTNSTTKLFPLKIVVTDIIDCCVDESVLVVFER
uniref:Bm9632, isoform b n=1 Tax=Brugia malayi TaxID=6279 RepID=A0A1I9G1S9_BRUMA|nr:Bm9632, isoform b [Brugia malayi]